MYHSDYWTMCYYVDNVGSAAAVTVGFTVTTAGQFNVHNRCASNKNFKRILIDFFSVFAA